eukprot:348565-Hanusia_phi.AAC.1
MLNVFGNGFGNWFYQSISLRGGGSSAEISEWGSSTSLSCKLSFSATHSAKLTLTLAGLADSKGGQGSLTEAWSTDLAQGVSSLYQSNKATTQTGSTSVTVQGGGLGGRSGYTGA